MLVAQDRTKAFLRLLVGRCGFLGVQLRQKRGLRTERNHELGISLSDPHLHLLNLVFRLPFQKMVSADHLTTAVRLGWTENKKIDHWVADSNLFRFLCVITLAANLFKAAQTVV